MRRPRKRCRKRREDSGRTSDGGRQIADISTSSASRPRSRSLIRSLSSKPSEDPMSPKVLISDKLSPAAVQIFKDRGVAADVKTGLDKDQLAAIIGDYEGLAIRSATKVTAKLLERAAKLKVVGRAGIGVDNVDIPAATTRG